MYGDSLSAGYGLSDPSQGWVSLLQQQLNTQSYRWRVVNHSISGETTRGGLERLPRTLRATQPDLLLLELGANDALQGLPLPSIKANLEQMIAVAHQQGIPVLLFEMHAPPNYGIVYTQAFNQLFHQLSQQKNVTLVPFFLKGVAGEKALNQADGIHPNQTAQVYLFNNTWAILKPIINTE